ncbi:MAG: L,D-transpeptidase family protein [Alphaproteobacteria bacterium]|nr:L,D-transpeptidase family protein [Alphaproteobacteria bacterium]
MSSFRHRTTIAFALTAGLLATSPAVANAPAVVAVPLAGAVASALAGQDERLSLALLRQIYGARANSPAWVEGLGLSPRGEKALAALEQASSHAIDPAGYHLPAIAKARHAAASGDAAAAARLELLLSDGLVRHARDLAQGQIEPRVAQDDWTIKHPTFDGATFLAEAMGSDDPGALAAARAPKSEAYGLLRQALTRYRALAEAGGWPAIPDGPKLEPGMEDERVPVLRRRLAATGELAYVESKLYDEPLKAAIELFQIRHGLTPDAVIGHQTLASLNVPAERRVAQIVANLERWRWLPREVEPTHISVNVAAASLKVIENGVETMAMRVIAGDPKHHTPVIADVITAVTVNPAWHVPQSIAGKEILPQLRKNPNYLAANRMTVMGWDDATLIDWHQVSTTAFPFRLRQNPGPDNSLGLLKFNLTNPLNIYLHDTPTRHLFARDRRWLSHGCVRLQKPADLAQHLLGAKWTPERLNALVDAQETVTVGLPKPMPVYLLYWTAWVEADGSTHFRGDIYDRDSRLNEALSARRSTRTLVAASP